MENVISNRVTLPGVTVVKKIILPPNKGKKNRPFKFFSGGCTLGEIWKTSVKG